MVDRCPDTVPTMLRYKTYVEKNSLYNTPPSFAIYVINLVLKWLDEDIGGLEKMAAINTKKADILYSFMEASGGFFTPTADVEDRSQMNVTFRLPDVELEGQFVTEAMAAGFGGLKGHRSVGGCRASIYNATGLEAVEALVSFMADFAKSNG
jgi:phosphoserine aminotransferase